MRSLHKPSLSSLRTAIDAKCRGCTYDEAAPGTWREQVAQCSCLNCPLWAHRPEPRSGRFAHPPRDPEAVTQEWLRLGIGAAFSPTPMTERHDPATTLRGVRP